MNKLFFSFNKLTVIGGPMFSGKTTWLIEYAINLPPHSFLLCKPDIDTRYNKHKCVTHNGRSLPAVNLNTKKVVFPTLSTDIKTILIDELNFFSPTQLLKAVNEQKKQGRNIFGAGALYDYKKKPFGATLPLSKIADRFIQLYAKCDKCKKDAVHSYRKVKVTKQFLLGGKETYGASCDMCWELLNRQ